MCHLDADSAAAALPVGSITETDFTIDVTGATLPVFQASPVEASNGNVVIIHDIHGANVFYHDLARRLAGEGYTAYLPDLFVRQGPLADPSEARARGQLISFSQAIEDIGRLLDAINQRSPGKTGAVGFCMGGTLVMLLASREPRIVAGAIYYGFPANPNPTENRPWQPLDEAADVNIPLLGFWGDQDHGVGMDNVETYRAGLEAAGKTFGFTIYPGLPHGFLTFDPASPNYEGSQDSWQKLMRFYSEQL
jgi:carboxymethylenebutenolidase